LFYGLLPTLNWPSLRGKKSLPRSQWDSLRYIPWSVFVAGVHSSHYFSFLLRCLLLTGGDVQARMFDNVRGWHHHICRWLSVSSGYVWCVSLPRFLS
jgi:hypothetical protein